jgi:hypothetical protein
MTLEPHVFRDPAEGQTKEVPCSVCGHPCVVHAYAADKFVKCFEHKTRSARVRAGGQKSALNPAEPGITDEERAKRLEGRRVTLRRKLNGIVLEDEYEVAAFNHKTGRGRGFKSYDPLSGVLRFFAVNGGERVVLLTDIVNVR